MTPHPLATWVQMSVSPQRHAIRQRRRRRAARLMIRSSVVPTAVPTTRPAPVPTTGRDETGTPRIPQQRRPQPERVGR